MYTDSKQVFDLITRIKRPKGTYLAIDVTSVRKAFYTFDIERVRLVKGEDNTSDVFCKLKNNGKLQKTLARHVLGSS